MASRDAIVSFLDELLEAPGWPDYGPNGLQVPGAEEVGVVATGVSANLDLLVRAGEAGAQMVICHHGLFWGSRPQAIGEVLRDRLKALFDADLSLASYHLPLDAHPEVGNNALICEALGLARSEPFGEHNGRLLGFVGRSEEGLSFPALLERCGSAFQREPLFFDEGPDVVRSVGILSGGGASSLDEAVQLGLDAFLTGEPSEPAMAEAREAGVHFIAAGHYATETFGVRRLGEVLSEHFGVAHRFIEVRNPV